MNKIIKNRFERVAQWISDSLGTPYAFTLACLIVALWAATGPLCNYSDTWQLVINTGTTIATFLMMFLLQNTGNRTIDELSERLRRMEIQNARILELLESHESVSPVSPP